MRLLILLLLVLSAPLRAAPDAVILVRHADKAAEPAGDPALSPSGATRAEQLATALADAGVGTILITQFRRSAETAAPIAAARGLKPTVVAASGDTAAHVAAVAEAVRAASGTVRVVGHSNTVPAIIAALGGPRLPDLCEASFGQVFVLHGIDRQPRLQRWRYGVADPAPATGCL